MIVFEQCKINPEGNKLIIEAVVENYRYFDDVYISSITVDNNNNYSAAGPVNNPVFEGKEKRVRLCLSAKDLNLSTLDDNIFIVYARATGIPSPDTPCGMDNEFTMAIALNLRPIYNMAMGYIKELDSSCNIPKGFIDAILRIKALKLALKTGNYPVAFKYWDKLFKNKISVIPTKHCGCNGIN